MPPKQLKSLPWDVVEKAISKEVKWLKETILKNPYEEKDVCRDCIYRRWAILILSGKVKTKDIKSTVSLWGDNKLLSIGKPHGREWHTETMRLINSYFKDLGYDVVIEPNLNMGRADLGVYKNTERPLFVEIGTVSLSKLLFNLETMEGSDFLLVLNLNSAVELSVLKADFKHQTT